MARAAESTLVNLIPSRRLIARRSQGRVRMWGVMIVASAGLLMVAYLINWLSWDSNTEPLSAAIEQTELKIKEANERIARQGRELREADAKLKANRAVGEQPDWSKLLDIVASRLGEGASLRACVLTPVARAEGAKAAGKKDDATKSEGGRPELLTLTLKGIAREQVEVSAFVLELELAGVFDRVQLVETRREAPVLETNGTSSQGGIAFDIVCELSDPGGSLR